MSEVPLYQYSGLKRGLEKDFQSGRGLVVRVRVEWVGVQGYLAHKKTLTLLGPP